MIEHQRYSLARHAFPIRVLHGRLGGTPQALQEISQTLAGVASRVARLLFDAYVIGAHRS